MEDKELLENKIDGQLQDNKCEEIEVQEGSCGEFLIPMDIENIVGAEFDQKNFDKGVFDYSYFAGGITAMVNAGLDMEQALSLIINNHNVAHNLEIQKIVCENNIKVAEIQEQKMQSNTL